MSHRQSSKRFAALYDQLRDGRLTRREFTARALALGVAMPVVSFLLRADDISAGRLRSAGGMEGRTRGEGGELRLIQWQAATVLSPHVATGTKDHLASDLVFDPLINYLPDGSLIPNLVTEVPTIENGLLAADLTRATLKLRDGVLWSDGEPFTADDVVFTWQWIMDPANLSVSSGVWEAIASMEAVDPLTVEVTYNAPYPNWFQPLSGGIDGSIYPKHVLESGPEAHTAFVNAPIGTGPYVVESFTPNDQAIYAVNENFRFPDKPYFARVNLKGGGDAASAARSVLQTGDFDYAFNVLVEREILDQLAEGGAGTLVVAPGNQVEAIRLQFADPNKVVDGQRAEMNTPHPFLTDRAVRQAINLAMDRETISTQFYFGDDEPPTANILANTPLLGQFSTDSPNTAWEFNVEKGKQLLEEAGWTMQGDVRAKDGVELRLTYATSINSLRQKVQAVVKQGLEEMGFRVQLKQIDAGVMFDSSPGNEQSLTHRYDDLHMYANNPSSPFPLSYMNSWYAGPNRSNFAQKSNQWSGNNFERYYNPEYDRIYEAVATEADLEAAAQMFIEMNDILINDVAIIPLINRSGDTYAIANTLR